MLFFTGSHRQIILYSTSLIITVKYSPSQASKLFFYFKTVDRPPSTGSIVPVVQELVVESKKAAASALSAGRPNRGMGCAAATASAIFSFSVIALPISEPAVRLGATQFTRIAGASSAASDTVSPSIAALLEPMTASVEREKGKIMNKEFFVATLCSPDKL